MLCSDDPVIVQFNQLEFALFFIKNLFDVLGHLIVHHIQLCLVIFAHQFDEIEFVCIENAYIIQTSNGSGQKCI
jgi:hypothetical protein